MSVASQEIVVYARSKLPIDQSVLRLKEIIQEDRRSREANKATKYRLLQISILYFIFILCSTLAAFTLAFGKETGMVMEIETRLI